MAEPRSEPSMEDILASIKRIIADEPGAGAKQPQPIAATAPAPAAPPRTAAPHIPSVVSPMPRTMDIAPPRAADREPPPPWPARGEPQPLRESVMDIPDRAPEAFRPRIPTPEPVPTPPPLVPEEPAEPQPVQRAVERLRQAEAELPPATPRPVPRDLLPRTPNPRPTGGDVTLDALVREMLQPMLAEWIDKNLPDMVERMVQAEIRRMIDKEA